MSVIEIKEIRVLPPLAIGRFGSSPEPMTNYDLSLDDTRSFRALEPAETLVVDTNSGKIVSSVTPASVQLKDAAGRVKPVAPILEVWARFDEESDLRPLTKAALADVGLVPDDLEQLRLNVIQV